MKKIIIASFLLTNLFTYSQKYEFGKVTIDELKEKVCSTDTSAVAAVLFKKGETTFLYSQEGGFDIMTKVKTRIKIYKKEGYGWANQKMQYYIGDSNLKEKVSFSDAVTYNLVNDKIEKTKLKSYGEFDEAIK